MRRFLKQAIANLKYKGFLPRFLVNYDARAHYVSAIKEGANIIGISHLLPLENTENIEKLVIRLADLILKKSKENLLKKAF